MGTRGFVGFVVDEVEKITYNHFDSYPDALGLDVLAWLQDVVDQERVAAVAAGVRQLKIVSDDVPPTAAEQELLREYADARKSSGDLSEWYVLLRETQGDPAAILSAGYMEDGSTFPLDSLFAEWGYVADFDREMFEVYRGFQNEPHDLGRFAGRPAVRSESGYYPVRLIAEWPFSSLPSKDDLLRFEGVDNG